jgi:hypothetical protein
VGFVLDQTAAVHLTAVVVAVLHGESYDSSMLGWRPGSEGQE